MRLKEVLFVFILCLQVVLTIVVIVTILLLLFGVRTFLETTVGQAIFSGIGFFSVTSPIIVTLLEKREWTVHFKIIERVGKMLQTIIIASGVIALILMLILKLSS